MEARIHLLFLALTLPTIAVAVGVEQPKGSSEHHGSILKRLEELNAKYLVGCERTDVVMVLDMTDSSGASFTSLITGAGLKGGKPKSIIPDVMVNCDAEFATACYVFPGFNTSRDVQEELSRALVLRKTLACSRSVKFLIAIPFESLHSRQEFVAATQKFVDLIKDLEKYRDAMALVVTDVPSNANTTVKIQMLLKNIRSGSTDGLKISEKDRKLTEKMNKFIDIMLVDSDTPRIGIIRRINDVGSPTSMPQLQSDKLAISRLVKNDLVKFRAILPYFAFNLSDSSVNQVLGFVNEIRNKMIPELTNVFSDIKRFALQQENENAKNLTRIRELYSKIDRNFVQYDCESFIRNPNLLDLGLLRFINASRIILSDEKKNKFTQNANLLEFADAMLKHNTNSKVIPTILDEVVKQMDKLKKDLKRSVHFFQSLKFYWDRLAYYDNQKRKGEIDGSRLMKLVINNEKVPIEMADLDIKSPLAIIDDQLYNTIEHTSVGTVRLKLLQSVWSQSMLPMSIKCSADGKQLTVYGNYVIVSDAMKANCWAKAESIEIFALNKVFINVDIKPEKSTYLAIIAAEWEVVDLTGNGAKRKIHLNGGDFAGLMFGIGEGINNRKLEFLLTDADGGNGKLYY